MPQNKKHNTNAQRQAAYRARMQQGHQELLRSKGLPPVPVLTTVPGTRRWRLALDMAHQFIATVTTEMTDYGDERSESWQEGESGEDFQERQEATEGLREHAEECLEVWRASLAKNKERKSA